MVSNRFPALVVLIVAGVGLCKEVSGEDAGLIPVCSELWTPFNLSAYPSQNKAMKISWHLPEELQKDLITFSLNISAYTERVDMGNSTVYFAIGLTPWTEYNITLSVFNDSSLTCLDRTTVRTLMTEPNEPSTLTSTFYNSSSVEVNWESPSEPNGNLKGYIVIWTDNNSSGKMNTSNTFAILNDLHFETKYNISVAAYNEQTSGILIGKSKTISVSTDSGVPSNVTSLTSDQVTNSTVHISWNPPKFPNGHHPQYTVFWKRHNSIPKSSDPMEKLEYEIENMSSGEEYTIMVEACNTGHLGRYCGDFVSIQVSTDNGAPEVVGDLSVKEISDTSVTFQWKKPKTRNGPISGYIISYDEEKDVNDTFYTITNLKPWTFCAISVRAYNVDSNNVSLRLEGPKAFENQTTYASAPEVVEDLSVKEISDTSLTFQWKEPKTKNGPISGYIISYDGEKDNIITDTFYTMRDLNPWTFYAISVRAFNVDSQNEINLLKGPKTFKNQTTFSSTPDVVEDLSVKEISDTSVTFQWKEPKTKNGPISGYIISYDGEKDITTTDTFFTVRNLKPWTFCAISVRAFNVDSQNETKRLEGPKAYENQTTLASIPGIVQNLSVKEKSNSSLTIQWQEPKTKNGPLSGYIISYHGENEIRTKDTFSTLRDLKPYAPYNVSVKAYNVDTRNESNILEGLPLHVFEITSVSAPPLPKEIKLSRATKTEIMFILPKSMFSSLNGPIVDYVILVDSGNTLEKSSQLSYETNQKPFNNWNESQNVKQIYRSSPTGWNPEEENDICKKVNDVPICTVGSQNNCENVYFCNGPLKKKTTYRIKVRGYTEGGWSETNAIETTTGSGRAISSSSGLLGLALLVMYFISN